MPSGLIDGLKRFVIFVIARAILRVIHMSSQSTLEKFVLISVIRGKKNGAGLALYANRKKVLVTEQKQ